MKLTFLGTGAGNFRGDRRHMSSALVEGVLLDCGAGTTGRLHDAALFDRVDGILVSHLHSDHIAGLFDFLLHTLLTGRRRPLTIVSPPGLAPILRAMIDVGAMVKDPADLYDFRLIEGLVPEVAIGPWGVRGVALDHTVYNLGYLLSQDGTTVFYTGDTREPSVPADVRADFVLHESTYSDRNAHLAREFGHSTASQAARAATAMGARRLFLTHIGGDEGTDAEILREARRGFSDSTLAEDRSQYDL
ncbi:MAG TPA: MBL fold metallo-hydrolase [Thermoplasmata archaeon]|nr:MBL fold metallo-hydrolase [Thermoplasmata archaeon]